MFFNFHEIFSEIKVICLGKMQKHKYTFKKRPFRNKIQPIITELYFRQCYGFFINTFQNDFSQNATLLVRKYEYGNIFPIFYTYFGSYFPEAYVRFSMTSTSPFYPYMHQGKTHSTNPTKPLSLRRRPLPNKTAEGQFEIPVNGWTHIEISGVQEVIVEILLCYDRKKFPFGNSYCDKQNIRDNYFLNRICLFIHIFQ